MGLIRFPINSSISFQSKGGFNSARIKAALGLEFLIFYDVLRFD